MDIDISAIDNKSVEIKDFIIFVEKEFMNHVSLVKNGDYKRTAFSTSNQTNFKKFFEEIIPLMLFLKYEKDMYSNVKYMSGDQIGDAILDGSVTVEITKAQNERNYLKTQDMLKHGYAFSVKGAENKDSSLPTQTTPYVYRNQEHVQDVCLYMAQAIKRKQDKKYPPNSILLILFDSDSLLIECDEDYSVLEKEIKQLEKGSFSKIHIMENVIDEKTRTKWQYGI